MSYNFTEFLRPTNTYLQFQLKYFFWKSRFLNKKVTTSTLTIKLSNSINFIIHKIYVFNARFPIVGQVASFRAMSSKLMLNVLESMMKSKK